MFDSDTDSFLSVLDCQVAMTSGEYTHIADNSHDGISPKRETAPREEKINSNLHLITIKAQ